MPDGGSSAFFFWELPLLVKARLELKCMARLNQSNSRQFWWC